MVFPSQTGANANPPHPDTPAHFTCDDGSVTEPQNPPPPPVAGTVQISLTKFSEFNEKESKWTAVVTATLTLSDAVPTAMANVAVTGTWSGGSSGTEMCLSDASGLCVFRTEDVQKPVDSVIFAVEGASAPLYAPDGLSIEVDRPPASGASVDESETGESEPSSHEQEDLFLPLFQYDVGVSGASVPSRLSTHQRVVYLPMME
jgi:hypothetical protein